ncbi:MAG TPA: YIP1 family protein, partial [Thermoanaerobaculia bacterium]|nr:YIP1 family protein [Thermoanaerobaculia bacterium]
MSSVPPQGPDAVPPPPPPPPPTPPPYLPPPGAAGGLPWEAQALGPESFFETAKLFITAPDQAWRLTRETGDYMRPLLFAVIVGWVGAVFSAVWGSIFGAGILRMLPGEYQRFAMMRSGGGILFRVVFAPIAIAIGLFILAAILHVSFMIVGALASSRSQFEGTFRLVCYASVA